MIRVKPIIPKSLKMFLPAAHKRAIERTLRQGVSAAQEEIKSITREWSTPPAVQVQDDGYSTTITIEDKRWLFLDEGTKAHKIIARRKKALFWPGARHPVKRVNHPGIKARYLTKQVQRKVDATNLAAAFANAVQEFTR